MRTITDLSQEEQRVLSDLRREIAGRLPDLRVRMTVFGTRARGDAEPESDMDVLREVETDRVAPSDKARLRETASEVSLPSGIIVSLLVVDQHILKERGDFSLFDSIDLTFDQYRSLRMQRVVRDNWKALAGEYELEGDEKKGLSDVFGQITNIEIPVPKTPLFSIFGKNIINIRINGSVDIHGAFRNTKSDIVTANPLDQSRSEPDFDQQVRVGVKGEIGDKLRIDADWDTERTFEYENPLNSPLHRLRRRDHSEH